jgi:hypothetical protein
MDMKTLFCVTFHVLAIVILTRLIACCLMAKSTGRMSTGTVFSSVQYWLGYCEGEMACVLMISPEVQRLSLWHTCGVIAGTTEVGKQQIFLLLLLQVRTTHSCDTCSC